MATIKQIDGRTIHQIQSGQVIVDLCSVVKELVENSIDAEATSIDVRFKNQGLDSIEVQDNGSGISPSNYPSVALKHHTSKLSSYSDIASLRTFGFRGEALASLCALSTLSVTTCQASEVPKGARLSFEPSGQLKGTSIVAAQKGTTVSVENIFHNLPVRRRELERNVKREWHKVIALLNQYACIQTNLKFSVSQQPTKGKRIHLFSTRGNPSTRENIINIFGAKTMVALVPLDLKLEMQPSTSNRGLQMGPSAARDSKDVQIVGHVSRPAHGEGRQTPDRQMFFVNGRPCGLPQFAKVFNEVYKSFNSSQNPFILANIQLDTDMYDVNISPDKRSILLHDQNDLLDTLRDSLMALFDSHDYSLPTSQLLKHCQPEVGSKKATPSTSKAATRPVAPGEGSRAESRSGSEGESDVESPIGKSLAKDDRGQNLISRWVERKTTNRHESPPPLCETTTARVRESGAYPIEKVDVTNVEELSTSESEDDGKPRPVKDFNKRLAEFSTTSTRVAKKAIIPSSSSSDEDPGHGEAQVSAIQPPRQSQADHLAKQHTPVSHKRVVRESATIVIGDQTVGSGAGSSESPDSEAESIRPGQKSVADNQPRSSFGDRLTQLFSASGKEDQTKTAADGLLSAGENEKEEQSDGESSLFVSQDTEKGPQVRSRSSKANTGTVKPSSPFNVTTEDVATGGRPNAVSEPLQPGPDDASAQEEIATLGEFQAAGDSNTMEQREQALRSGVRRKDATFQTVQHLRIKEHDLQSRFASWITSLSDPASQTTGESESDVIDLSATDAEEKLSLTISKGDFGRMRVAGQFNLGFIIAVRPSKTHGEDDSESVKDDELFIIDQHATDEKYNYERLQATTIVQSQRLVHPKRLELAALEEEVVMENIEAIEANGFKVHIDTSGDQPVGSRCQVLALPLSRETTFTLKDLEELIFLLGEESSESKHIPRPSKVKKMFAMRACRSSIMIGKPLTQGQMESLVRHMEELDNPWNCPHGRPTMRHLCKLQLQDGKRWKGDMQQGPEISWRSFAQGG
ncbi:hypothetical protein B0T10DRAFT_474480 [Thelonectria olida]|uniref:DNA mismatch repair protein PMS1 n=1 Tax=Thelonectria olida TaxID=1576542 RepID=A0A9P9AT81_9HYPO|nr:hypothetical protein B0T10DRAFT_474480 [Thelonectria olida]